MRPARSHQGPTALLRSRRAPPDAVVVERDQFLQFPERMRIRRIVQKTPVNALRCQRADPSAELRKLLSPVILLRGGQLLRTDGGRQLFREQVRGQIPVIRIRILSHQAVGEEPVSHFLVCVRGNPAEVRAGIEYLPLLEDLGPVLYACLFHRVNAGLSKVFEEYLVIVLCM